MSRDTTEIFLQRNKMDELLYDLSCGIVSAKEQRLLEEDIKQICEGGQVFKLGDDDLISKDYLKKEILKALKIKGKIDNPLIIKNYNISLSFSFVSQILDNLVTEKVVKKEGDGYIANFDVLISKETISKVFQYKINGLKLQDIAKALGFASMTSYDYNLKRSIDVDKHCEPIVNNMVKEEILIRDQQLIEDKKSREPKYNIFYYKNAN